MATMSFRARQRRQMMAEMQAAAVAMFEERGFGQVTVEEVAGAVGVSASTVYRYFGTKEALVIHDPQDAELTSQLERRLRRQPAAEAFRDASIDALAGRDDIELFRRRVRLIFRTPALWAAALEQDSEDRRALAAGFAELRRSGETELEDEVLAAVCLTALDVALDWWQRDGAQATLAELIHAAFAAAIPSR